MKLNIVPARAGWQWALMGVKTFWRQPLAMGGLFFMLMAAISMVSMVPVIGGALALVLLPTLTLGMMVAADTADKGTFPLPPTLFVGLRDAKARMPLLQLGGWYAVSFFLVLALFMAVDGGNFAKVYLGQAEMTPEIITGQGFQSAMWISTLLYVPLAMMFWHAPALVYWHGVSPVKSLFFSLVACWKNLKAFGMYVVAWSAIFVGTGLLALSISSLLGNPGLMGATLLPLMLVAAAMFFTSMTFTVRDCLRA